jgi:fucose 4-O-acetylase-like acetyltransferase
MVKSDILLDNALHGWFNQTIYYFHVPLFFICSGYLFQKFTQIETFAQWGNNFLKKFISLAVPYFVFSLATYIMKTVFADSVNKESGGLIDALFLNPTSPYWYLYAMVFIFLITVTINSKGKAVIFIAVALAVKVVSFFVHSKIYALETVLQNEIWFVSGMLLCYCNVPEKLRNLKIYWGFLISVLFIAVSVVVYCYTDWNDAIAFLMGVFGCISVLLIAIKTEKVNFLNKLTPVLAKYTFPVFLMHTIFAAGFRSVLLKIGISNSVVHIILGLTVSFVGPMLAAVIMKKIKWIEFLLYPTKIIRIGGRKNGKKT